MSLASVDQPNAAGRFVADTNKQRRSAHGTDAAVLADIYNDDVNIAIWQRQLSEALQVCAGEFVAANPRFQDSFTVTPQGAFASVSESLAAQGCDELSHNIAELVEMFCCLVGLQRAGLRLATLEKAMCPRFHVDRVPCRLLTTYVGIATEWLPHQSVNRSRLGVASHGMSDDKSGVFVSRDDIRQLHSGDVALLKGELWEGNENAGLVHRSPAVEEGERRLLLSLDFAE